MKKKIGGKEGTNEFRPQKEYRRGRSLSLSLSLSHRRHHQKEKTDDDGEEKKRGRRGRQQGVFSVVDSFGPSAFAEQIARVEQQTPRFQSDDIEESKIVLYIR